MRWAAAVTVLVAAIAGFYYFSDQLLIYRVAGLLVAVAAALALVVGTQLGQWVLGLAKESQNEVRKMVWPTRQETMQTTWAVAAMVLVVGVFLWLLDMLLGMGLALLTGIRG
jgi:preprotein translocase subunit SecE